MQQLQAVKQELTAAAEAAQEDAAAAQKLVSLLSSNIDSVPGKAWQALGGDQSMSLCVTATAAGVIIMQNHAAFMHIQ